MIHQGRFEAKVAVVTGAAQGIGYTVAANLAREGGKVALVDRSELIHEVREKLVYELRDKLPAGLRDDRQRVLYRDPQRQPRAVRRR
jgi:NAD(P)-dependent dehydrogenase (short-subunit alcohol dehydrogenase family)